MPILSSYWITKLIADVSRNSLRCILCVKCLPFIGIVLFYKSSETYKNMYIVKNIHVIIDCLSLENVYLAFIYQHHIFIGFEYMITNNCFNHFNTVFSNSVIITQLFSMRNIVHFKTFYNYCDKFIFFTGWKSECCVYMCTDGVKSSYKFYPFANRHVVIFFRLMIKL